MRAREAAPVMQRRSKPSVRSRLGKYRVAAIALSALALIACADKTPPPAVTPDSVRVAQRPAPVRAEPASILVPYEMMGPTIDSLPLDSCARLDSAGRPQSRVAGLDDVLPMPSPGNWAETKRISLGEATIDLPVVAVDDRKSDGTRWITKLPGCRYFCALEINFDDEPTGAGIGRYLAQRLAVDSSNGPDAADWVPGLPKPLIVSGLRGAMMEIPCGDCSSGEIVSVRGRRVARLGYSHDDREGYQPGLMCRMARVAASMRWIDRPGA